MSQCEMFCPLCRSKLELKQINYTLAIYMCLDLNCPYPVNDQCIEVERKLEDMHKPIEEVLRNRPAPPPSVAGSDSGYSNDSFFFDLELLSEANVSEEKNDNVSSNTSANIQLNNSFINQMDHVDDIDDFLNSLLQ